MKYYTWVSLCRDCADGKISEPYVAGDEMKLFETKEEALRAAYNDAEDETVWLNEGADPGISFGIAEDGNDTRIVVNYYYGDNTEWVTKRILKECRK